MRNRFSLGRRQAVQADALYITNITGVDPLPARAGCQRRVVVCLTQTEGSFWDLP